MRSVSTFAVLSLFVSCVPAPAPGNCTVKDEGDGTKTISCPDGTSAKLSDGAAGAQGTSCSASESDGGPRFITCTDGTSVAVNDGATGPAGATGPRGTAGVAWLLRLETEQPGVHCGAGGTQILSGPDMNANGVLDLPEVRTTAWACNGESTPPCTRLEGDLTIHNSLDWANLVRAGCASITGELLIDAPGLTVLDPAASSLVSVGSLRVQNNDALTTLSLPALATAGRVELSGNDGITSVELPKLLAVRAELSVTMNRGLQAFKVPALENVDGALVVKSNLALEDVSAQVLRTIGQTSTMGGELTLSDNDGLQSVSLPALTAVRGPVEVRSNSRLTQLSFPMLTAVSGALTVESNATLRQCLVDEVARQLTSGPSSYVAAQNDGLPNVCP